MSVVERVTADLDRLPPAQAESGLAAMALALAEQLDEHEVVCKCGEVHRTRPAPSAMAACARELREVLTLLHELAPPKSEDDEIDRARKRRADRLEGKSAAGPAAPS